MRRVGKRKLLAADFESGNEEHMELIKKMGITIVSLPDGRVQLLQSMANVGVSKCFSLSHFTLSLAGFLV